MSNTLRSAMSAAQEQARDLNQDFVGTEHLVLGVLSVDGEATKVMRSAHADVAKISAAYKQQLPKASEVPVVTGDLPMSPKAARIINSAIVKTQSLRESRITTRALLLVLMEEPGALFCQTLQSAGADVEGLQARLAEKVEPAEL